MATFNPLIHHHYNPMTGEPCGCHYERPRPKHREASQAVRQIRNQNQKFFRDEAGKKFLDSLEEYAGRHDMEPLVPWIANRYKKGDFDMVPHHEDPSRAVIRDARNHRQIDSLLPNWIQWMQARQHPLRRGVNIMELDPSEVTRRATQLRQEVAAKREKENWLADYKHTGSHVHTFDPTAAYDYELPGNFDDDEHAQEQLRNLLNAHRGWQVHELHNDDDTEAESAALGHCIGSEGQNYRRAIEDGRIRAFSLRDQDGYPKVTFHFNEDNSLAHIQGKSGYPKEQWRDLISLFNHHQGFDDDDGGSGSEHEIHVGDDRIELPDPTTIEDYHAQHGVDSELWDLAAEHGEPDEHTEIVPGSPDWEELFSELTETHDPHKREHFYNTVMYNGHHNGFQQEVDSWDRLPEEQRSIFDRQIQQEWRQAFERSHNQQGAFVAPTPNWERRVGPDDTPAWNTQWQQMNQPLFNFPAETNPEFEQYREHFDRAQLSPENWGQYTDPFGSEGAEWGPNPRGYGYGMQPVWRPPGYFRRGNILDPIHLTLDARVWDLPGADRPLLKRHHKEWITREIFRVAAKLAPNPERWLRLVLTGSLTTYQYSDTSDCDVSLFVNAHFMPEWDRAKLIGLMVGEMDGTKLPGTPFEMQDFVVAKSISPADLYQPGLRSGYDIESDTWLNPPERDRVHDVEAEFNSDYVYALESADKMERLLRYDPDKAVDFWHQIHRRRMRDQRVGKGDFSQANIVYKFLANRGLFPEIAEAAHEYIAAFGDDVTQRSRYPGIRCPNCGRTAGISYTAWLQQLNCYHCGYRWQAPQDMPQRQINDIEDLQHPEAFGEGWDPADPYDPGRGVIPSTVLRPLLGPPRQGRTVVADKLNDFLMNPKARPDLQTPEAQQWLQYLQNIHTERNDALMPWLTREWKKGRLTYNPDGAFARYPMNKNPHEYGTPAFEQWQPRYNGLTSGTLSHWADWYHSDHPTRRGVDVMKMQMPDMHDKMREWDQAMAEEAEEKRRMADPSLRGEVVHSWPDGWTVQKLKSPESLEYEGDCMGHCVGGYGDYVDNGKTMIYSLRDHKNVPHITAEIEPKRFADPPPQPPWDLEQAMANHSVIRGLPEEGKDQLRRVHRGEETTDGHADWPELYRVLREHKPYGWKPPQPLPLINGGRIEQIQGQGNTIPKPPYQDRMREFFETLPEEERPAWGGNTIRDLDELRGDAGGGGGYTPHGDYGVQNNQKYDWERMVMQLVNDHGWYGSHSDEQDSLLEHATHADQLHELLDAVEYVRKQKEEDFVGDTADSAREDEVADWAGLQREDYFDRPEPEEEQDEWYDPEDDFNEVAWEQAVDENRRPYAEQLWEAQPMAEYLYDLESQVVNALPRKGGPRPW